MIRDYNIGFTYQASRITHLYSAHACDELAEHNRSRAPDFMAGDREKRHTHFSPAQRPLLFDHQRRVEQLAHCHSYYRADLGIIWAQHRRRIDHSNYRRDPKVTW